MFASTNWDSDADESDSDSDFFGGITPVFNTPVESDKSPAEDQSGTTSTIKVFII